MQTNIYFYINAFQHTKYCAGAQVEALTSISETLPGIVSKLEIESNVSLINNHVEKKPAATSRKKCAIAFDTRSAAMLW